MRILITGSCGFIGSNFIRLMLIINSTSLGERYENIIFHHGITVEEVGKIGIANKRKGQGKFVEIMTDGTPENTEIVIDGERQNNIEEINFHLSSARAGELILKTLHNSIHLTGELQEKRLVLNRMI